MNEKGVKRLLEQYPDTQMILTCDNGIQVIVSDRHGQSDGEPPPNCPVVCENVSMKILTVNGFVVLSFPADW